MSEHDFKEGQNQAWRGEQPPTPNPTHTSEQINDRQNGYEAERKRLEEAKKPYNPNG